MFFQMKGSIKPGLAELALVFPDIGVHEHEMAFQATIRFQLKITYFTFVVAFLWLVTSSGVGIEEELGSPNIFAFLTWKSAQLMLHINMPFKGSFTCGCEFTL